MSIAVLQTSEGALLIEEALAPLAPHVRDAVLTTFATLEKKCLCCLSGGCAELMCKCGRTS